MLFPGAVGSIQTDFKPQIEELDKTKFTIIAWDPPGYGKSRPPLRKFTKNFYFDDANMAVKVMAKLNLPKYSLLGWSDGGISSMILAAQNPDKVESLVIWGSNSYILPDELKMFQSKYLMDRKKRSCDVIGYTCFLFFQKFGILVNGLSACVNQ